MATERRSRYLKGTTWIVPPSTLPAYVTLGAATKRVSDQTVWIIDDVQDGYIFGTAYTTLDAVPFSKTKIIGSITPDGSVLFAFHASSITSGSGTFQRSCSDRYSRYIFLMQTNSLSSLNEGVVGLSHWSIMTSVTPTDEWYRKLPGVGISVPDFVALFD